MQLALAERLEKWKPIVVHGVGSSVIQNDVHTQFREVRENLESGQPAMRVVSLLAQAVNRSLLLGHMA